MSGLSVQQRHLGGSTLDAQLGDLLGRDVALVVQGVDGHDAIGGGRDAIGKGHGERVASEKAVSGQRDVLVARGVKVGGEVERGRDALGQRHRIKGACDRGTRDVRRLVVNREALRGEHERVRVRGPVDGLRARGRLGLVLRSGRIVGRTVVQVALAIRRRLGLRDLLAQVLELLGDGLGRVRTVDGLEHEHPREEQRKAATADGYDAAARLARRMDSTKRGQPACHGALSLLLWARWEENVLSPSICLVRVHYIKCLSVKGMIPRVHGSTGPGSTRLPGPRRSCDAVVVS